MADAMFAAMTRVMFRDGRCQDLHVPLAAKTEVTTYSMIYRMTDAMRFAMSRATREVMTKAMSVAMTAAMVKAMTLAMSFTMPMPIAGGDR